MMDYVNGWMNGAMGNDAWIGTVVGALVVVLLIVVIVKQTK